MLTDKLINGGREFPNELIGIRPKKKRLAIVVPIIELKQPFKLHVL